MPLEKPPFYALAIYPGDIGTNGGLVTDSNGAVMDDENRPIAGLYATGNVTASPLGRSYPGGGATLGPAMTFGYLAGRHAAGAS
jgi:3-oxosteroid 1-dehydrogenase